MLTKPTGTVDMEDGNGVIVSLPTFPQLQKNVNALTDTASGAVAGAQASASAAAGQANAAAASAKASSDSKVAALASQVAAKASQDAAAATKVATDTVAADASTSATAAAGSATLAGTKATAADTSAKAAATSAATAGLQADTVTTRATAAATSATAADTSRSLADKYANEAVNVPVTAGRYSAYHWSEQARLNVLGSLVFKGKFDASKGTLPASPVLGDFYVVSAAGTISSVKYSSGDMLFYDGTGWDRIDNQTVVQSVAGRTGNVVISISDLAGLQGALDSKQVSLGYNPVQQGTGVSQTTNVVKIGWSAASKVKVTIDNSDQGNIAMESWCAATFCQPSGSINNAYNLNGIVASSYVRRDATNNTAGMIFASGSPPNMAAIDPSNANRMTSMQISNGGNTSASAMMSFIREGQCGVHFGLDTDNVMKIGGWSYGPTTAYRVIHEGVQNWNCLGQIGAGTFTPTSAASASMSGNGGGVQMNGTWYSAGSLNQLWNNSSGWVRVPRTFVQSADPGAAAGEGDLWIW